MEFYPAIQSQLGSWTFYSTKMTAKNLAHNVQFAAEIWDATSLDTWIQRTLDDSRAKKSIASYLARHDDRFFNSIVVAALEGNPHFIRMELADDPKLELLADQRFLDSIGVLRFDGSQKYYALDGQHRLKAIKALLEHETEYAPPEGFQNEEFSVLIVVPAPTETRDDFLQKYRRLFGHLNRYAKPMDLATTIIMEEDDALAISTRRLLQEHPFFSRVGTDGEPIVKAQGSKNIPVGSSYFTSIIALYDASTDLLYSKYRKTSEVWGQDTNPKTKLKSFRQYRPDEEVLEGLYSELSLYWDAILNEIPELVENPLRYRSDAAADELDEDGKVEKTNHLLFRPLGTDLLSELVRDILDIRLGEEARNPSTESVSTAIRGLGAIDWRLFQPPWRHLLFIYDAENDRWKMRSEERKEALDIARQLLRWMTRTVSYDKDMLATLRSNWANTLYNAPNDEIEDMWDEACAQAARVAEVSSA